ncbi:hypothetical protein [Paenibacillus polymyxa]|nr:hypothetical protein [Paenibacillus polymyxa]MBY7736013.1 hypothetical protein [Paenibacillus polymyxa]WDZ62162.1 hypothetical protein MF620_07855 [Paenibacillus polymyxa]
MIIPQMYIVGHSIGGQVVTEFALSYPSMIALSLTGFAYSQEFTHYN